MTPMIESPTREDELELRCSYDLAPVPARRRARREAYCSESCRRAARNWRRRQGVRRIIAEARS